MVAATWLSALMFKWVTPVVSCSLFFAVSQVCGWLGVLSLGRRSGAGLG